MGDGSCANGQASNDHNGQGITFVLMFSNSSFRRNVSCTTRPVSCSIRSLFRCTSRRPVIFDGFVKDNRIYILDFICCGPYELEDCDFDCRRTIGKSYLDEKEVLTSSCDRRNYAFTLLEPTSDCNKQDDGRLHGRGDSVSTRRSDVLLSRGWSFLIWMFAHHRRFLGILHVRRHSVGHLVEALDDARHFGSQRQSGLREKCRRKQRQKQFMEDFAKNHSTYSKIVTKKRDARVGQDGRSVIIFIVFHWMKSSVHLIRVLLVNKACVHIECVYK